MFQRLTAMAACLCLAFFAMVPMATAQVSTIIDFQVFFDTDNNTATGCDSALPTITVNGAETLVTAQVDTATSTVTSVDFATCAGGAYGVAQPLTSGYPIALDQGLGGADALELALTFGDIGLIEGTVAQITAVVTGPTGNQDSVSSLVNIVPPEPVVIPLLGGAGLLILTALLLLAGIYAARRHRLLLGVSLVCLAGVALAAHITADGNLSDWAGTPPTITDALNDPQPMDDPRADIVALFVVPENPDAFVRIDVVNAQFSLPPQITSNGGGDTAAISIAENVTAVTDAQSTDPEGEAEGAGLTYSLTTTVGGADNGLFTLDANSGTLTFTTAPDFENPTDNNSDNVYEAEITVSDSGGETDTQAISVTVTDATEPPEITSDGGGDTATISIAENTTAVTDVQATDPEGDTEGAGLTYSLTTSIGGQDNAQFTIDPASGVLAFSAAPDFDVPTDANTDNVYEVEVTVTDSGAQTDVQTIAVTVTNEPEPPEITSNGGGDTAAISVPENTTPVTDVQSTDPEGDTEGGGLTYSLTTNTGGADNALFNLDASTGVLSFSSPPNFEVPADANTDNDYEVEVTVTDSDSQTDTQTITVTVTDQAEVPIAADDQLSATTGISNGFAAGALFADNGSGIDVLGEPAATIASFGGGSFAGAVTDNVAGSTVAIPVLGGTLTIGADGSATIDNPTTAGTFTVQYRLDNGAATSDATVTVNVVALPVPQNDGYTFPANVEQTIAAGSGLFADNGSGTDFLGSPTATLTSFGAGSLGGTVTDNAAGASVTLAGGTLTVGADGSWSLTGQPFTQGVFTFDYRLTNTVGTADATVTLQVDPPFNNPPQAQPDAYNSTGNVGINQPAATGLLANDTDLDTGDVLTATAETVVSTQGGSATISADGSFVYTPPAGFNGADTFTYTLNDNSPLGNETDTAVATITVNDVIWFVDASNTPPGTGTLADPFATLAAATVPAGECVFVSAGAYVGPFALSANQVLGGQAATLSVDALCGVTLAANSNTLPTTGGAAPTITSSANAINVATGNTITGLDIGNTTGAGIAGTAFGTLTVSTVGIRGSGVGIDVDNGNLAASFSELSSSDNTAVDATNVSGDLDVLAGTVNSGANQAVNIVGSPVDLAVSLTSVSADGAANAINIVNTTGSFAVSGDGGTTAGVGGTLQNIAGDAVTLTDAQGVSLRQLNMTNVAGNGVLGVRITGFGARFGNYSGIGDAPGEEVFKLNSPTPGQNGANGTVVFEGLTISNFAENGIEVVNEGAGSVDVDIINVDVSDNNDAFGADAILISNAGAATADVFVSGGTYDLIEQDLIEYIASGTGGNTLQVSGATSTNGGGSDDFPNGGGIAILATQGTVTFDINGNNFSGVLGEPVAVVGLPGAGQTVTLNGVIGGPAPANGNIFTSDNADTIDLDFDGDPGGGSTINGNINVQNNTLNFEDDAIGIDHRDAAGTVTVRVLDNTINGVPGIDGATTDLDDGIFIFNDDDIAAGLARLNTIFDNNTFSGISAARNVIEIADVRDAEALCVDINNSSIAGGAGEIELDALTGASLLIAQASIADLSTVNNSIVVDDQTDAGTVTFGATCP